MSVNRKFVKLESWCDVGSHASGRVAWFFACCIVVTQVDIAPVHGTHLDLNFDINLVSESDPFSGVRDYGDVWAEGNYAYVGSRDRNSGAGVTIFDISDPSNPLHVSTYVAGPQLQDVKVQDGIGYFASNDGGGVDLVDLSDPTNPTLITNIDSADGGFDKIHNVFIDGDYLYQAPNFDNIGMVKVFDVSNPFAPTFRIYMTLRYSTVDYTLQATDTLLRLARRKSLMFRMSAQPGPFC